MFGGLRRDTLGRGSKLLHSWLALEGSLEPLTGEGFTYTRAAVAWSVDANGNIYPRGGPQPRFESRSLLGRTELGLLLEPVRTNLVVRSGDFGTGWTLIGSPTRTLAMAKVLGVETLDLIGDDSGAAMEGYAQTVAFTSSTAKAIAIILAPGLTQPASGTLIRLEDVTAGVNRLVATVTWPGGVPSFAMAQGAVLSALPLKDGTYLCRFRSDVVTHTNTNRIAIYPAGTLAQTGDVYAGGVHVEQNWATGAPIPTTASTAATGADDFSFPWAGAPRALTMYGRFVEQGSLLRADPVLSLGDGTNPQFSIKSNGAFYGCEHHNGLVNVTSYLAAGTMPLYGDVVEVRAVLRATGAIQFGLSVNGGTELVATSSAANALAGAWGALRLGVGQQGSTFGQALWLETKVAGGEVTMAKLRTLD
jgi:hypothetical protein